MITADIICDSKNPNGQRLTTFVCKYPRFIHSEVMTHRALSKNAASSRAIPFRKMAELVKTDLATPEYWGTSKPGMQSGDEVDDTLKTKAIEIWERASFSAVQHAEELDAIGIHKSIANRILEPFLHMTTLITGTDWENFFALRAHQDAQPEFQVLAYRMLEKYLFNEPNKLNWGEWHIPFGDRIDSNENEYNKCAIATARCARLSYLTYDGDHSREKDLFLHDKLKESGHWSPFEHSARAVMLNRPQDHIGNFAGWKQYRKEFDGENRSVNLCEIFTNRPERLK